MAVVHVPPGEATEVAQKLLAAAERLGLPANVVQTASDGVWGFSFIVPQEVADKAYGAPAVEPEEPQETTEPPKRKPGRPRKVVAETIELPEEGE